MRTAAQTAASRRQAVERVRGWTRARFRLSAEAPVRVSEVECRLPGCAPIETHVAFWTEAGERRRFKVFKPVAEVAEEDLPPAWMKDRLVPMEAYDCACC
jgi:nitrate reductase molybdenum cofactor assembly chaperone NarJ/NarW